MKACIPCSRRHVKCDRRRPVCARCEKTKSNQGCTYPGARFRRSRLSIAPVRDNVESPPDVASRDLVPDATDFRHRAPDETRDSNTDSPRDDIVSIPRHPQPQSPQRTPRGDATPAIPLVTPPASRDYGLNLLANLDHYDGSNLFMHDSPSNLSLSTYNGNYLIDRNFERIKVTDEEATLFQCYLEHAGVWLDVVSPSQCFSQTVPKLALHNPVLYYSCLAYAAHVLFLWGRTTRVQADYYHNQAITLLIPLLDPKSQSQTQLQVPNSTADLLATIVILRMSEQFSEPAEDAQCHLFGAFSLLTSTRAKWSPGRIDLRGIAFWTFVRQTLRICFLFEQECRFDLDIIDCNNMLSPATDEVWTNRMTYFLAKACNICWDPETESRDSDLEALEDDIKAWHDALPQSFRPWYYHQEQARPFPTVRYLSRWHVLAWQQYYTAKTMFAIYRRKAQSLSSFRDINNYVNSTILLPARLTCGVVLSDTDTGSCINGAHLAYWCGQFFTGREEQRRLLEWLEGFMGKVKWPNRTCIVRLQNLWGVSDAQREGGTLSSPPIV
ncbi:hypothetical protein BJY04DRAFT_223525 [Aspergillus karnatakaensis]|uniref:Zn(II)2Cys6 transcription factor n=1 Tax=Aspergillus karnatakaensis TaxID=1810916 RepID=UPI003CCCEF44